MSKIYLALYKKKRKRDSLKNLWFRLCDDAIRFFTKSKYSHCELVFKIKGTRMTYECYSSSIRDKGVRQKQMRLNPEDWDLIEIKDDGFLRKNILKTFELTKGMRYDLIGALGVVLKVKDSKSKFFCSEWCAYAMNLVHPEQYSPGKLADFIRGSNK